MAASTIFTMSIVVDSQRFERSRSQEVATAVARFNRQLNEENRPYLLIGVGRWGSTEPPSVKPPLVPSGNKRWRCVKTSPDEADTIDFNFLMKSRSFVILLTKSRDSIFPERP